MCCLSEQKPNVSLLSCHIFVYSTGFTNYYNRWCQTTTTDFICLWLLWCFDTLFNYGIMHNHAFMMWSQLGAHKNSCERRTGTTSWWHGWIWCTHGHMVSGDGRLISQSTVVCKRCFFYSLQITPNTAHSVIMYLNCVTMASMQTRRIMYCLSHPFMRYHDDAAMLGNTFL